MFVVVIGDAVGVMPVAQAFLPNPIKLHQLIYLQALHQPYRILPSLIPVQVTKRLKLRRFLMGGTKPPSVTLVTSLYPYGETEQPVMVVSGGPLALKSKGMKELCWTSRPYPLVRGS